MSFEQDGTGVTAVLQDRRTCTEHVLQRPTTYLIAADGEPTAANLSPKRNSSYNSKPRRNRKTD